MKRTAFVKELTTAGCLLQRHGGRHDLFVNPASGRKAPVPRHKEIKDSLCALIRRQLGIG